jgi:hypothetical protein
LKLRASLTSATIVASDLYLNPLSYISKVARQSGRAASAGGHHGGPRGATRRSQPDSPGGGAAPTLSPAAAQMTATKKLSDVLFPRGFEVASPRRSLQPTRTPSSCLRRSMYPRRKKFFSHIKKVFFHAQQRAVDSRNQAALDLTARDSVPPENEINTAKRSNALLTCRLVVF